MIESSYGNFACENSYSLRHMQGDSHRHEATAHDKRVRFSGKIKNDTMEVELVKVK